MCFRMHDSNTYKWKTRSGGNMAVLFIYADYIWRSTTTTLGECYSSLFLLRHS
jgi:hypothetical protein